MRINRRAIGMFITAVGGFATTVLSCIATDKAKKIIHDDTLSTKDKVVGVVKCYVAPAATAVTSIAAGMSVVNGYEADLKEIALERGEREGVLYQYRTNILNMLGTNKEREIFDKALYDNAWIPPKEAFKKLKPGEMLFYDSVKAQYFSMPYEKMMALDNMLLNKVNSGAPVMANEYYKAVGFPVLPVSSDVGWRLGKRERPWDQFFYYSIYNIKDGDEVLGKMAIIHEYVAPEKKKEVIDGECKEVAES